MAVVVAAALLAAAGTAAAGTDRPAASCRRPATPGVQVVDVQQDGASRPVRVWIPAGYDGTSVPLLLWLHGSSSSGPQVLDSRDAAGRPFLTDDADEHGYVVAAPTGSVPYSPTPELQGFAWNIPGVPLVGTTRYPEPTDADDIVYTGLVLDAVSRMLCIDADRVYATGASGGGRMASQLACDLRDRITAIAPIMGVRTPSAADNPPRTVDCGGGRAVPVLAVHGALDPVNAFSNDDERLVPRSSWTYGVPEALRRRAVLNGCDPAFPDHEMVTPNVRHWRFRCPAGADVALHQVLDGGHTIPGSAVMPSLAALIGPTNAELDTPELLWSFLSRFSRR